MTAPVAAEGHSAFTYDKLDASADLKKHNIAVRTKLGSNPEVTLTSDEINNGEAASKTTLDEQVKSAYEAGKTAGKSEAPATDESSHGWVGISAAAVIGLAAGALIVYLICHNKNKKLKAELATATAQGG